MSEIIETKPQAVAVVEQRPIIAQLIELLPSDNRGVERIRAMIEMAKDIQAENARAEFNRAMAQFRSAGIKIIKSKEVGFNKTSYRHATISDVVNAVVPIMSECNLSHRWKMTQEGNTMTVTCVLTHTGGHSEEAAMTCPYDTSGSKNPIQAIASSKTYLERYTLLAVTGLTTEDGSDDDAEAAYQVTITKDDINQLGAIASREKAFQLAWAKLPDAKRAAFGEDWLVHFRAVSLGQVKFETV